MVHAGLWPDWSADQAQALAEELESVLRGARCQDFLAGMYGNEPRTWKKKHAGQDRLRFIANVMTRMRYLDAEGALDFQNKGAPARDCPTGRSSMNQCRASPARSLAASRASRWASTASSGIQR